MDNMKLEEENGIIYPYIVFKIFGKLYCVTSKYISTIMQLPNFEKLPDADPCITGVYTCRGELVQMLDLRTLFRMPSLAQEYQEFSSMIDVRKQDHINWVNELKKSVAENYQFPLATDPHKCAFGRWYDSFYSENNEVNLYLKKLEFPHKALHEAAVKVGECNRDCGNCKREKCLEVALKEAEDLYMPQVLDLLDGVKEVFKSAIYHEMSLVLNGGRGIAIVVDEVLSVEQLTDVEETPEGGRFKGTPYISGVKKSAGIDGLIMEIDVPAIIKPYQKDREGKKEFQA